MTDFLLATLAVVALMLACSLVGLTVYVRRLRLSIECLCSNIDALRQQIGQGGHPHA